MLSGGAFGRWTRWHPLAIGTVVGLLPGALGAFAMMTFATEVGAILLFGALAFFIGSGLTTLGAYIGWLRRKHIEKVN